MNKNFARHPSRRIPAKTFHILSSLNNYCGDDEFRVEKAHSLFLGVLDFLHNAGQGTEIRDTRRAALAISAHVSEQKWMYGDVHVHARPVGDIFSKHKLT